MQVKFEFHTAAVLRILQGAEAEGITPEAYLLKGLDKLQPAVSTRSIKDVLEESIRGVQRLTDGVMFLLDDVSDDYRDVLTVTDRQQLGKQFRKAMENAKLAAFVQRNEQNQAIYRRTE